MTLRKVLQTMIQIHTNILTNSMKNPRHGNLSFIVSVRLEESNFKKSDSKTNSNKKLRASTNKNKKR